MCQVGALSGMGIQVLTYLPMYTWLYERAELDQHFGIYAGHWECLKGRC